MKKKTYVNHVPKVIILNPMILIIKKISKNVIKILHFIISIQKRPSMKDVIIPVKIVTGMEMKNFIIV